MINLFKSFMKRPLSYDFLATNTQLKELLVRRISPALEAEGYQYNGEYQWIGPWENHSRRVIRVRLLKGAGGEFAWGWCFDFIPVPNGNGKGYHYERTDKSADLQLFVWSRDLISKSEINSRAYEFSLFGADLADVEQRLIQVFQRSKSLGDTWFRVSQGSDSLLAEAVRQSRQNNCHSPTPTYIKAFLLSALGQTDEGMQELDAAFAKEYRISEELQKKLCKKLQECRNVLVC